MKRIHIVGCGPRSGTTLLAEAMAACCNVSLARHEDRIFKDPPEQAEVVLTKAPRDIMVIAPFLAVNPDLHVICMIRDPRDMIVSKHGRNPDRYWAGLRYWKAYVPRWRKIRHHPRFITVRYEDLVSDPDGVQQMLLERIPFLTVKAPFSRYHEVAQPSEAALHALRGIRPIAPVGVGNYRRHLARVSGQLILHGDITPDLIEFGYERDGTWKELLDGMAPDLTPSHWPEYFSKEDTRAQRRGMYKAVLKVLLARAGMRPSQIKQRLRLR